MASTRSRLGLLVAIAVSAALIAPASAEPPRNGPVLHEQLEPDPGEDVTFSTTTLEGDLPAAIQTPSGLATAPDPRRAPTGDHVYGSGTTDDSPDSTYEPDRDTRRPHVESYDDPFSPATAPFKRLRAYDWVDADYSLRVRDKSLRAVPVGGTVGSGDEPFYGDLSIDLLPGQAVRIPTVGPGSKLLRMHVNPEMAATVQRDLADNWFLVGPQRARVRLVMELAIPRDTFGRDFGDVEWSVLDAVDAGLAGKGAGPPGVKLHEAAFKEVIDAIGVSRAMRPRDVVRKLVTYFRAFAPSEQPPTGRGDIYLDLALSKKGVCRHRAFAFLVTALGLGIPARMVVNEAHAWVEVFDGKLWHRVDLGGAAANLDTESDAQRPPYVPPPDPYAWPDQRDSGQDMADRSRSQNQSGPRGAASGASSAGPTGSASAPSGSASASAKSPNANDPPEIESKAPASEVSVTAIDGDVRRGLPIHLQGVVMSTGAPCPHLRIDVMLTGPSLPHGALVGSLSTDERGKYDGAVIIPRDFALGDYDLVVQTPGDARCGPGRTR